MGLLRALTIDDLKNILARALLEPDFLRQLKLDADAALTLLGIQPTAGSKKFFECLQNGTFTQAADTIQTSGAPRPPNITFK